MLKQWFLGRKKYSSTNVCLDPHQDPNITCPLGERYVVYRTNPIYIDDNHWTETDAKHSQISILAPHDPKLHVQTWCSLVCPRHLTTCCACKPAWIYCDNCHPPIRYHSALPSPDILPYHSTRRVLKRIHRKKLPEMTLSPRNLLAHDKAMEVAHYYHVIEPVSPINDLGKCQIHNGIATNQHFHHDHRQLNHYQQQPQTHKHHAKATISTTGTNMPPLPNHKRNGSISHANISNTDKKPPLLQIYINSDFVSGIAVTGSNAVINDNIALPTSSMNEALETLENPHYMNAQVHQLTERNMVSNEMLDMSAETDSLESLRIDEQIFAPAYSNDGSSPTIPSGTSSGKTSENISEVENVDLSNLPIQKTEGISPTGSKLLLTDSELAYEAVRDLYEKLSNNRHRQVVAQAISGTQRSRVFKNYVQNTYETLTKHVRGSYAKLVEEELQRTPSHYLVPTGSSTTGRSPPPPLPPATDSRGSENHNGNLKDSKVTGLRVLTGSLIEMGETPQELKSNDGQRKGSAPRNTKMVPDVAYEVTNSDQFITRRDPKYGEQPIQTGSTTAESPVKSTGHRFYDGVRKRFKQKNYRDAFKIIITTLVGLTAFGIITALSLSINRQ